MSSTTGVLRIGEVHAQLRREFPDIELSKIRYYEEKGLVQPARSRKGYRLYSERDVACLREAIRLAQEEFVPLKVVRLRLIDQGLLREDGRGPLANAPRRAAREVAGAVVSRPAPASHGSPRPDLHVVSPSNASEHAPAAQEFFSANEVMSLTGLAPEHFNLLVSMGIVEPRQLASGTVFRAIDVRVCAQTRALLERGVDPRFLGSLRRVVEREVGVIEDMTASLISPGSGVSADKARAIGEDVARDVGALRAVLSERALSDYFGE
ncbi:MAG: MerR family transcriptional regulator [Acidobacteriota bacterium]|nr:MerR family transcriptional regulator [Acidobacteriota bacterium]